jgi:hypothetical protein
MVQVSRRRTDPSVIPTLTQKEWVEFWRISLELITVNNTVKASIVDFKDNHFFHECNGSV